MNIPRVMILVVAAIAGGGAFYLSASGGDNPAQAIVNQAPVEEATARVLFAKEAIPQGSVISEKQFKWVKWPAKIVPDFLITEDEQEFIDSLVERRARIDIRQNEPISEQNTVKRGDRGMMAALMTSGMRAVTARVTAEQVSGGFVLPGDRVDIFATGDNGGDEEGSSASQARMVLSNVRVIAIDQAIAAEEGAAAIVGKTVTLEVTPKQVQSFIQARENSDLTLVLRSVFEGTGLNNDIDQSTPDQVVVIRYGQG